MSQCHLLAIESSNPIASVAIAEFSAINSAQFSKSNSAEPLRVLSSEVLSSDQRTAKGLLPTIKHCLQTAGVSPSELALVAVCSGPGSFTGLRIGVTAAKTLAYAADAPVVGVNTLDLLAHQVLAAVAAESQPHHSPPTARVWAVLDAQRGDLFAACYAADDRHCLGNDDPTRLVSGDGWLAELASGDIVVGPVASKYADRLPDGVQLAEPSLHLPRAAAVCDLGYTMRCRNLHRNPFELVPQYHRLSAAEEKARTQSAK